MLHEAGQLTLDLALELLDEGIGLKDATPYNVLFSGARPVFVDLLSFERRAPGDATWLPYAQFTRNFLLPLLASRHFHRPLAETLLTRRDGLEPEEVYRWTGPLQRLRPSFLSLVSLPTWFAPWHNPDTTTIYQKRTLADTEKAQFILRSVFNHLRRMLNRFAPKPGGTSTWSGYMASKSHYTEEHFLAKEAFVHSALEQCRPRSVLDIGCNTGHFSVLAARAGSKVVAIDYDPVVAGMAWRLARQENLDILPLVVNLAWPSPGMGWSNSECPAFLDRAEGAFDMVFMLATLHHLVVTERIPLPDIFSLAAKLTTNQLIVEFVSPEDPMFKRLVRGREELHRNLNPQAFELACTRTFKIVRTEHVEGTHRWLYLLQKHPA
jgi:SAM-dependent methyltransferase